MVIQCMANLTDGMTQRFLGALAVSPNAGQKRITRYQYTGLTCELQENFSRLRGQVRGSSWPVDLPFKWFDEQITEIESVHEISIHGYAPSHGGRTRI